VHGGKSRNPIPRTWDKGPSKDLLVTGSKIRISMNVCQGTTDLRLCDAKSQGKLWSPMLITDVSQVNKVRVSAEVVIYLHIKIQIIINVNILISLTTYLSA
jgi:hypothetical protein